MMRRILKLLAGPIVVFGLYVGAVDRAKADFTPQEVTWNCFLGGISTQVSAITYAEGITLNATNIPLYVGTTTNTARLMVTTNDTIIFKVGSYSTNVSYTGNVQATNGLVNAQLILPNYDRAKKTHVQVTVTSTTTNVVVFPRYEILTEDKL